MFAKLSIAAFVLRKERFSFKDVQASSKLIETSGLRRDFRSDKSEETSDPNTLAADCSTSVGEYLRNETQNNKKVKRGNN